MEIYNRLTGKLIVDTDRLPDHSQGRLGGANLMNADLRGKQLAHQLFIRTNLRNADFTGADMPHVNLAHADVRLAIFDKVLLAYAWCQDANFNGASLRGANLHHAKLDRADLRNADFAGANLENWSIRRARLDGALGLESWRIVPPDGMFIGYKKLQNQCIATLHIPEHAQRMNAIGSRICRASEAVVIDIVDRTGTTHLGVGHSLRNADFEYRVGATVKPDFLGFDPDETLPCSTGIHFFMTREEAERYSG